MLVAGLKQQPHFDVQHVVAAHECPSAAARQDRALEFRAIEVAALEPCDTPDAIGVSPRTENSKSRSIVKRNSV
jgi:hypothetical protein